jgi:DNA mismatch repair ATPase MutS
LDNKHPYTGDLDIFGEGSLFQMINVSSTYAGRGRLKEILSGDYGDLKEILLRQEAVSELADMLKWRQSFQASGYASSKNPGNTEALYKWGRSEKKYFKKPWAIYIPLLLPPLTLVLFIMHFLLLKLPLYASLIPLVIQMALLAFKYRETAEDFNLLERHKESIRALEGMLKLLEEQEFKSAHISNIKEILKGDAGREAYRQIRDLSKVEDMISFRYTEFYLIFDILAMWDYRCAAALERWRERSGVHLEEWFDAVGEMEVLCCFASLKHDHPDWALPRFTGNMGLIAKEMGHPLLPPSRVCNDFSLEGAGSAALITGSNMSGKSTFLRTAGVNLVLAYAGAPVCASDFQCSIMHIYSSMRINDSLDENISSFYAELLRIKIIIEAVQSGRKVFFLLDEIFKGTNSADRHTGGEILIKKLTLGGAAGLVSTHDLELGVLEGLSGGRIQNFNFQEHYSDGEIHFDYKLRKGISTTRNAMYLMRLAGVDIPGESLPDSAF